MAANVWDNSSLDGKWSTDANWSLGHVPTTTETATFDATSNTDCAVDIAVDCLGIDINAGYTAVITQGNFNIVLGTDGFDLSAAATFTGNGPTYKVTNAGNWVFSAGTVTIYKTYLVMTGAGVTITGSFSPVGLDVQGSVTISAATVLTVYGTGGAFIVSGLLNYTAAQIIHVSVARIAVSGVINGPAQLGLFFTYGSFTLSEIAGALNCPVTLDMSAATAASRTLTLGNALRVNGLLTIKSSHAVNTMTLNLAGHRLECASLTVGTRGNVTGTGDSSVFCMGALTQSDATPTTIANGGFPFWATGGVTGMGAQSNYVGNGRSMCRMMARSMPKRLSQKWGVG